MISMRDIFSSTRDPSSSWKDLCSSLERNSSIGGSVHPSTSGVPSGEKL
jgi:hypothetical protein